LLEVIHVIIIKDVGCCKEGGRYSFLAISFGLTVKVQSKITTIHFNVRKKLVRRDFSIEKGSS
jgi:hypothetical protein